MFENKKNPLIKFPAELYELRDRFFYSFINKDRSAAKGYAQQKVEEITLLHQASYDEKNPQIFDALIEIKSDIHSKDSVGRTPLHYAVIANNEEAINDLLNHGAEQGHSDDVVNALPQYGANPFIQDNTGAKKLELVAEKSQESASFTPLSKSMLEAETLKLLSLAKQRFAKSDSKTQGEIHMPKVVTEQAYLQDVPPKDVLSNNQGLQQLVFSDNQILPKVASSQPKQGMVNYVDLNSLLKGASMNSRPIYIEPKKLMNAYVSNQNPSFQKFNSYFVEPDQNSFNLPISNASAVSMDNNTHMLQYKKNLEAKERELAHKQAELECRQANQLNMVQSIQKKLLFAQKIVPSCAYSPLKHKFEVGNPKPEAVKPILMSQQAQTNVSQSQEVAKLNPSSKELDKLQSLANIYRDRKEQKFKEAIKLPKPVEQKIEAPLELYEDQLSIIGDAYGNKASNDGGAKYLGKKRERKPLKSQEQVLEGFNLPSLEEKLLKKVNMQCTNDNKLFMTRFLNVLAKNKDNCSEGELFFINETLAVYIEVFCNKMVAKSESFKKKLTEVEEKFEQIEEFLKNVPSNELPDEKILKSKFDSIYNAIIGVKPNSILSIICKLGKLSKVKKQQVLPEQAEVESGQNDIRENFQPNKKQKVQEAEEYELTQKLPGNIILDRLAREQRDSNDDSMFTSQSDKQKLSQNETQVKKQLFSVTKASNNKAEQNIKVLDDAKGNEVQWVVKTFSRKSDLNKPKTESGASQNTAPKTNVNYTQQIKQDHVTLSENILQDQQVDNIQEDAALLGAADNFHY